ncbi:hypothetical protein SSX86_030923 [Deinandra increscens subsp. villosa]|uniref:Uncharacterized protein n=1 Tax=Deinandra increscens subsp. villosa TaxID=3103831 RepID=A0AAP0C3T0_9ASTR
MVVSASDGNDESRGFTRSKEIDMEGPGTGGFDFFFMDPVKKPENSDQKLSLEPLQLSPRLPSVLLPIGCQNLVQGPDSPSQEMSTQSHASSFQTSSDEFTRSFSGSQHFTHSPSCCSLTENSVDFEKSVGSHPLLQCVNWDEHKTTEPPIQQRSISNGPVGVSDVQSLPLPLHNARFSAEGSCNNNSKQPSGSHSRHMNEIRSPTQSVGSHETGLEFHKDKKGVMREVIGTNPADFVEPILAVVVSDPLHIVAQPLNEMTPQSLTSLKDPARDVILKPSKLKSLKAAEAAKQREQKRENERKVRKEAFTLALEKKRKENAEKIKQIVIKKQEDFKIKEANIAARMLLREQEKQKLVAKTNQKQYKKSTLKVKKAKALVNFTSYKYPWMDTSTFEIDETYENFDAPQWTDLSAAVDDDPSLDDWFCQGM